MAPDADKARFGGGTTAYEAMLERKRAALRKALRTEFIRQRYHPEAAAVHRGPVFDVAMKRWDAMKATEHQYYYPTFKNMSLSFAISILPMILMSVFVVRRKNDYDNRIRRGELAYDHPERKSRYTHVI